MYIWRFHNKRTYLDIIEQFLTYIWSDCNFSRPTQVYLRPAASADTQTADPDWLCGGVIIHERYVLTSAACIEDVKQFYVVSGTHR